MIKTIALTVTYSNRLEYLIPVIEELNKQNFSDIIIIFNGCESAVIDEIRVISKNLSSDFHLLQTPTNEGSAGGFHKGIRYAIESNIDYERLLILDDDNLIPSNLRNELEDISLNQDEILFISRKDRRNLVQARDDGNPCLNISTRNSFLGHDLFKRFIPSYENTESDIICAPYSGLVISKEILNNGVLPDKSYYLYGDDYEFSYRLVIDNGLKIRVYNKSEITDMETSFHISNKKNSKLSNRYLDANDTRIYHSVKNQIVFSKKRINNYFIFLINLLLLTPLYLVTFIANKKYKSSIVFMKGLRDGLLKKQ
ncbi:glycosyltransferase [Photobacterium sp.]|uniref:glycosyltransferase n=1 Tax=Photobacterium sp. TaxID=660 RepID=UPI00299EA34D|nr:hypothetical protein [Photobacterium sp.]MDX1303676.1 hypothetical protein [Photobacterium sp.]